MTKPLLTALLLIAVFGIGIIMAYRWRKSHVEVPKPEIKNLIKVVHIGVLKGHEFDLKLEDGRRVHAFLTVNSVPEATDKVIFLINNSKNPKVVLKEMKDGYWICELFLTIGEHEVNLKDWLHLEKMVWQ